MIEFCTINGLRTAIVDGCIDDSDVGRIAKVESLWLTPETTDFEVKAPLQVRHLRILYIQRCRQPLFELVRKECLARLRTLIVWEAAESLVGVWELGELPELKTLKIRGQELESQVVDWICRQKTIDTLDLMETNASDSLIARLGCKEHLKWLDLMRSDVSFSQPEVLDEPFPLVSSLDVSETSVSSNSIATIKFLFPRLGRFLAEHTQLRDVDVKEIASWEGLKILATNTPGVDFDKHGHRFWHA